jgi:hypothetical protein
MQHAAVGMLLAIVGTLMKQEIISYGWIAVGLVIGTVIGWPLGTRVPMTAMPQRIAISHMFGALAATLVGVAEYYTHMRDGIEISRPIMAALGFEVLFGSLTVTGSFMAFGKLQEILPGRPITYKGQNAVNISVFILALLMFAYLIVNPGAQMVFYAMIAIGFIIGMSLVLPIGGGDMPVVISLLNSYAGLAASATGFAIDNSLLIIAGALDGASGFILSIIMSKAMNRSFGNVIFGAFGAAPESAGELVTGEMKEISVEDAALQLAYAQKVIVVPGYGLAVAQAQQIVRELADQVERRGGGEVRHSSGGGPHAGPYERATRRGEHSVRETARHGRDQPRVLQYGCRRGDRQRRCEPGRAQRQGEPHLWHADPRRGQGQVRVRAQAGQGKASPASRTHLLRRQDPHVVRRCESDALQARQRDESGLIHPLRHVHLCPTPRVSCGQPLLPVG